MNQGPSYLLQGVKHVAVQIDPEGGPIQDAVRARRYLMDYFGRAEIKIYWGSTEDFVRELRSGWNEKFPDQALA